MKAQPVLTKAAIAKKAIADAVAIKAKGPQVISTMANGRCMRVSMEYFIDIEDYSEVVDELKDNLSPCRGRVFVTRFDLMEGDSEFNSNMLENTDRDLTL